MLVRVTFKRIRFSHGMQTDRPWEWVEWEPLFRVKKWKRLFSPSAQHKMCVSYSGWKKEDHHPILFVDISEGVNSST